MKEAPHSAKYALASCRGEMEQFFFKTHSRVAISPHPRWKIGGQ
jgi:hypothetical protein